MLKKLCKMKLNWDTEIPSGLMKEWNNLLKNFNDLGTVEVNRNVFVNYENDPIIKHELHSFSSTSLHAYGVTISVKTILQSGKVHTIVFTAISPIASLKEIIIPRLRIVRKLDFGSFAKKKVVQIDNLY